MVQKGILPPTLKMILTPYYQPAARQSPIHLHHPEFPSCSKSPMPCTKPESLGDDQTKSASLGAHADGRKEGQLETPLVKQSNDITGKHRDGEQHPLEPALVSEEEGKVVSKCERQGLKSPSACEGMEGPGEPQQTTAVDDFSHADCKKSVD